MIRRSVVRPKLVSKGAMSGSLISISSILSIFMVCKEKVFARWALRFPGEAGTIESGREVALEFFSNPGLPVLSLRRILRLDFVNLRRNLNRSLRPIIRPLAGDHLSCMFRINPPFGKDAISIETAMEHACARVAIVIDAIASDYGTQLHQVEIGIPGLKRVERPDNQWHPALTRSFELGQLELESDAR